MIDHTTDNALMAFRFKNPDVKMLAAEDDFELERPQIPRRRVHHSERRPRPPRPVDSGPRAFGLGRGFRADGEDPRVDIPRIGYVHSWQRTQDEGWVRAALDHYGVPYTYFADQKLREGNLRAKYDVIIFPHVGGTLAVASHRHPEDRHGSDSLQEVRLTPNLGALDQSDDIRGGMGFEGLAGTGQVRAGGRHADHRRLHRGAHGASTAWQAASPSSIPRSCSRADRSCAAYSRISRAPSPTATRARICRSTSIRIRCSMPRPDGGFGGFGGRRIGGSRARPERHAERRAHPHLAVTMRRAPSAPRLLRPMKAADMRQQLRRSSAFVEAGCVRRVVLQFPRIRTTCCFPARWPAARRSANRAAGLDVHAGKGHIVMFALRPFWRWQTQGTYFLASTPS